jgi:hypothetical protein
MQCDHKPIMRRKRLDFVSVFSHTPWAVFPLVDNPESASQ